MSDIITHADLVRLGYTTPKAPTPAPKGAPTSSQAGLASYKTRVIGGPIVRSPRAAVAS